MDFSLRFEMTGGWECRGSSAEWSL